MRSGEAIPQQTIPKHRRHFQGWWNHNESAWVLKQWVTFVVFIYIIDILFWHDDFHVLNPVF